MASRIGVAVIGSGYWGPNLIRNLAENQDCDLILVCDKDPRRLAAVRARHPTVSTTSEVADVLRDRRVDAVAIATPVSTHSRLVEQALGSGRHVLVEKPVAMSSRDASRLLELSRRKGKVLLAGHTFVYSPPVRKVLEVLRKKALGRVYYMDFSRVNLGLFRPDVNVLWDLASHDVSIAIFWLGAAPVSVRAEARTFVRRGIEEAGYLWMDFPGGVLVHAHVSWLAPVKLRRVAVIGSRQMLVYDDTQSVEKIKIYNEGVLRDPNTFGEFQLSYRSGDVMSPRIDSTEPLALECADFIHCIRTGGTPRSDGRMGVQVVRVLEAAQKSLNRNGARVRL